MKLLRRHLSQFEYRAYLGKQEILDEGRHTGKYEVRYADPKIYRGSFDLPNGYSQYMFAGISPDYTHVLLVENPNADIAEDGLIDWKGGTYKILQVRPSYNLMSIALKKLAAPGAGGNA